VRPGPPRVEVAVSGMMARHHLTALRRNLGLYPYQASALRLLLLRCCDITVQCAVLRCCVITVQCALHSHDSPEGTPGVGLHHPVARDVPSVAPMRHLLPKCLRCLRRQMVDNTLSHSCIRILYRQEREYVLASCKFCLCCIEGKMYLNLSYNARVLSSHRLLFLYCITAMIHSMSRACLGMEHRLLGLGDPDRSEWVNLAHRRSPVYMIGKGL
jgi:hypothetical protein